MDDLIPPSSLNNNENIVPKVEVEDVDKEEDSDEIEVEDVNEDNESDGEEYEEAYTEPSIAPSEV